MIGAIFNRMQAAMFLCWVGGAIGGYFIGADRHGWFVWLQLVPLVLASFVKPAKGNSPTRKVGS